MADLKAVYAAVDEQVALDALDVFSEHWDKNNCGFHDSFVKTERDPR